VDKGIPLTNLVTGATAAIIVLTGCVLYLVDLGTWGTGRFWPMILASSSATLLVMSLLHSDLQRLYKLLSAREAQAHHEARIDPLTGLANRKALIEQIEATRSQPQDPARALLLLLDLNHFKRINDARGHEEGDALLASIAKRLEGVLPDTFIARLGGDEFAIIASVAGQQQVDETCQRVVNIWTTPFALSQGECFVSGSLGAAPLDPALTVSELLRRADAAMYRAKSDNSPYKVFDDEMIEGLERRARLAVDLRNSFPGFSGCSAVFQPIVRRDGLLVGLETLLRWKHPQLGQIPPMEIVSLAEEVQLVNELGLVVAKEACRAAKEFPGAVIAFNASVVQFLDTRFESQLRELIRQKKVAPARLQIEVKESDFASRGQDMAGALNRLAKSGFTIAVDDYGSSTSSLVQLQRFGVTVLKLDPRVLRNARETDHIGVMRAKVELARALGMSVVCEGVAVEADRIAAMQSGCDMMQGYLLGGPQELAALRQAQEVLTAA
jgi:diguanylate cyclase (GGDEF)-like protein